MATINHRWVEQELKALLSLSQGVKKLARSVLEEIERDPAPSTNSCHPAA